MNIIKQKRVCLIITSLSAGGMQRVMSELAFYFSGIEYIQTHIIIYGISREVFYKIPDNVVIHKPDFVFNNKCRIFSALKTLFYLRNEVKVIKPDAALSFGEIWNSFVLIALFGLKFPIFISDRCKPDKSFGPIYDFSRKRLYPFASGVIAQTERAKIMYKNQFRNDNIFVIGNPIRAINHNNDIKKENIVVSVGRLIDTKNFDQLINIFYHINVPGWKLVIIGGDAIKQNNFASLKKQIESLGLVESVTLEGYQKNIDYYLLRSRIFAFTSSSEGFPNALGEAMSAGLPVVAYDCVAGPGELITDNEDGFLVPLYDEKKFEERLKYLMENPQKAEKMGTHARESIKRFSAEEIGEKYLKTLVGSL